MSNTNLDYKNKYLKYKQKYFNLKKMIGGGIDAIYQINKRRTILILTYQHPDNSDIINIIYTIERKLGKGSNGIVYLIKNINKYDSKSYIFKEGICVRDNFCETYNEGIKSEMLEGILDDVELEKDMLVLFQGKEETDFLISTYNGNDLYQEFKNEKEKIKEQYANVTTQLLHLLHQINSRYIFHNDIKLRNITIKDDKVYLIDFGLLTKDSSDMGTLISMSFNGVIAFLKAKDYDIYSYTLPILKPFLIDTDMVGFFYCCIDLLFLLNKSGYESVYILHTLSISSFDEIDLYKLFELFYFILPTSRRTIDKLNRSNRVMRYNTVLPSISKTTGIFVEFQHDNTNLFRFMAHIYNIINNARLINSDGQRTWYINFLKIMSDCFLPEFNYTNFKEKFDSIVSQFTASQSSLASLPSSLPASSPASLTALPAPAQPPAQPPILPQPPAPSQPPQPPQPPQSPQQPQPPQQPILPQPPAPQQPIPLAKQLAAKQLAAKQLAAMATFAEAQQQSITQARATRVAQVAARAAARAAAQAAAKATAQATAQATTQATAQPVAQPVAQATRTRAPAPPAPAPPTRAPPTRAPAPPAPAPLTRAPPIRAPPTRAPAPPAPAPPTPAASTAPPTKYNHEQSEKRKKRQQLSRFLSDDSD
jgi:serine/threonine protein kinase